MAKKEANKKEVSKNKKSFSKDFKAELKKVIWPTPKQLVNNTIAVITIVLITTAIVFVLDIAFETANKYGVNKIKEAIATSQEQTTDDNSEEAQAEEQESNKESETTTDGETAPEENTETETTENAETTPAENTEATSAE